MSKKITVARVMQITGRSRSRVSQLRLALGVLPERDHGPGNGRLYDLETVRTWAKANPVDRLNQRAGRNRHNPKL